MNAAEITARATDLIGGDRARTHGDKVANHRNIARLWNAYLADKLDERITPTEVALMLALLKIARTQAGEHNADNYVDLAGYAGCAGEIAEKAESAANFPDGAFGHRNVSPEELAREAEIERIKASAPITFHTNPFKPIEPPFNYGNARMLTEPEDDGFETVKGVG